MVWYGNRITVQYVDSFEDQDLNEYNSGTTSDYSVVDGSTVTWSPHDGSYMLANTTESSPGGIVSTSGLENYPAKGDKFNAYAILPSRSGSLQDMEVAFGAQDINNRYGAEIEWYDDSKGLADLVAIAKWEGGSRSRIATSRNVSFDVDTWHKIHIEWDDGTLGGSDNDIRVTVTDTDGTGTSDSASVNDSTYATETGAGWYSGANDDEVHYDDYRIV